MAVGDGLIGASALLWLFAAPAYAQEPPASPRLPEPVWYSGLPVADVRLLAPAGGLPEESLEPLLHAVQDAPLDPQIVRTDVSTLFRVGEFSAVEADVDPWVLVDDQGRDQPAVLVTYRVYPAPKVGRIRVQGVGGRLERDVLESVRTSAGEVFYPDLDGPILAGEVTDLMRRRGFPDAQVSVEGLDSSDSGLDVLIRIDERAPVTVDRLSFAGDLPVDERVLRRWARAQGAGVREGQPLYEEAITEAQYAIRHKLARMGPLAGKSGGWIEARVTPAVTGDGRGGNAVTYTVEPGARLVLDVQGLGWQRDAKVIEALGIDDRTRLTRGFLEAAPERVEGWLRGRGYYATTVSVSLSEEDGREQVLHVGVVRGPYHSLHHVEFRGNEAIDDNTLRTVMDNASDEVIRLDRVTDEEIASALLSVRDVYRANGYLGATAELAEVSTRDARWPSPSKLVTLVVDVEEGPLTSLSDLTLHGQAPEVDLSFLDQAREAIVGGPYSPQRLELLAREVVEAHRRAGYLQVDAKVVREVSGERAMAATIQVDTGPQVRLRSLVTRGARRTRAGTIRRELDLQLGQPVTSDDLEQVRRSLYSLDVFRTVSVELLGDEAARDMVVTVTERPRWAVEVGGGLSTDQGLRAFTRTTRRNLWGRAHRLDIYGLLGVDWRRTSFVPDILAPEWRAAITYTAPQFPLRWQELIFDLLIGERTNDRTWRLGRTGFGLALETRLGRMTTLRNGFRLEARRLVEIDEGSLIQGEPWPEILALTDELPSRSRYQDTLYALLLHDRRDNPLQPTRGLVASAYAEWGPGLKLTDDARKPVPYAKAEARITGYLPIRDVTLRWSGDLARAWTFSDAVLPLEDRYRLGGTGSLRGYARDAVGPRNEVEQPDIAWPDPLAPAVEHAERTARTRWASTGGDTQAVSILELLVPFTAFRGLRSWDGWYGALFADVGNVWLLDPNATATSETSPTRDLFHPAVRYGLGAGLRVATPVGPLQIDLATNPEVLRATGARKALLRDDWDEPWYRFHLSLGSLF